MTGACLAELGHDVVVRDIDPAKVEALHSGEVPIYEPGLGDMIARNKERLRFTLDLGEALAETEVAYVCVDTPPSASGDADLSKAWSVVRSLVGAAHLRAVVMKSTVPVGTGARARATTRTLSETSSPIAAAMSCTFIALPAPASSTSIRSRATSHASEPADPDPP
ncbi:hypothetical protein [Streptomyces sp. NPDC091278]|uniref:hypothetical protein n=1 Tax=Streptomyces sp. NPDC091278 TaxID=3155301 RepID=UPI00344F925F